MICDEKFHSQRFDVTWNSVGYYWNHGDNVFYKLCGVIMKLSKIHQINEGRKIIDDEYKPGKKVIVFENPGVSTIVSLLDQVKDAVGGGLAHRVHGFGIVTVLVIFMFPM